MSWTDEEIDKIFGEAADKQVFEYRSEYWNDIEKQLPIQKQSKRAYWWWTANIFFLGFLGFLAFDASKETDVAIQNNTISKTNPISRASGTENTLLTNKTNTIQKTKLELEENQVIEKTANLKSSSNTTLINHENFAPITPVKSELDKVDLNQNRKVEIETIPENQIVDLESEASILVGQVNSNNSSEIIELKAELQDELIENDKLELNTKAVFISENVSNLEPVLFPYKKDKLRKMYVEVFGGVGQSYIKNETNQNVVNATIGGVVGLSFPVKRFNISAGLGLQGTKFDQLNILERTKIYGLGSEILENSYEFSSIYSLTIPLSATYTIGRHSMNLGITSNINFMTQLKHRQTLDGDFKSYNVGFSDVSFFNRFGLLPSLGYSFHINEKTQIGIRMNIQLLQQIQSKRFIGAPLNFPIDGQIYLKRTLDF